MDASAVLSFDNAVFATFVFYATLTLLKMTLTANFAIPLHRVIGHVYLTPEDYSAFAPPNTKGDRGFIERIDKLRRIVANDMENIIPFTIVGLFYVLLQPSAAVAVWHFRIFAAGRFLHSVVYMLSLQPARFVCFLPGTLVTASMGLQVLYGLAVM